MTFSVDDLIATAQPRTQEVRVCARGDLVAQHAALVEELEGALQEPQSLGGSDEQTRVAKLIVEVEEQMEASTLTFVMQAISRRAWADLIAKHPPKNRGEMWNPETFPAAMVAACCKSPEMTSEQAEQVADVLPLGEWSKLEGAAFTLNTNALPHPKLAAASELVRLSDSSSTTADPEGSPAASSSDAADDQ